MSAPGKSSWSEALSYRLWIVDSLKIAGTRGHMSCLEHWHYGQKKLSEKTAPTGFLMAYASP